MRYHVRDAKPLVDYRWAFVVSSEGSEQLAGMRALAALLLLLALPAQAQVPICNALREGMTACFDGRLCACRFEPGGQLTARPSGHRWDCGALRPDCRPPPANLEAPDKPPWPHLIPPPQLWIEPPARR